MAPDRLEIIVNWRDDDLRVRPGRIRDRGGGAGRPKSFVGQVMRRWPCPSIDTHGRVAVKS